MRLKDKVAIITGGSRGIGYATADKFLKEGATVILTASSQGSADKAVAQLKEKYPDATVVGISPNLSNLESVRNAFREAASKYGCIDILVNNAGVSESTPFTEYTEETFDKVMDLNVKGVFNATRAASECMIAKRSRCYSLHILNGQHLRPAQWHCLSRIQICCQWPDGFPCPRIGSEGYSSECSRSRYYPDRYDEGCSQGSN